MLQTIVRRNEHFEADINPARISDYVADKEALVWVDICDPGPEEFRLLQEEFRFHPLSLEDMIRQHQRPKIEVYPTYYFMVVYTMCYRHEGAPLDINELDIFLGPNYVVTVHEKPLPELEEAWTRWQRRADVIGSDIGALLYVILDNLVDEYFPVIDVLADRVEEMEEKVFEQFDKTALEDIFELKKELLHMRRVVAPERDVLNVLLRRDPPILPAEAVLFFQDVYDHIVRVLDSIDTYRDLLSSALDAYLSVQSNNLNEVMRRLTVISTIFLPLTFITGFFGMNFEHIPFGSAQLLWLSILIMVATPVAMLSYFRWKRWS